MRVDAPMAVIAGAAAEIGEILGPMTVLATKAFVAANECNGEALGVASIASETAVALG